MTGAPHPRRIVRTFATISFASLLSFGVLAARPDDTRQTRTRRSSDRGMFVSVIDRDGAPVAGLTAADFLVREDGVAREVILAEKVTEPVTLSLLLDTTQASAPYMADMRRALKGFVKRMGGRNPIAITTFADRPTIITGYTLDAATLERGVERLFPVSGSGSYLLQGVEEVCRELAKRDFDRAVILAITAGGPEFSDRHYEEVVQKLRDGGAAFDAMVFSVDPPDLSDFGQRQRELFVEAATRDTGGDRFLLLSGMALDGSLTRLAAELDNQYRVTYARPETLIPPRKIEVGVRRPGLTARGTPIGAKKG